MQSFLAPILAAILAGSPGMDAQKNPTKTQLKPTGTPQILADDLGIAGSQNFNVLAAGTKNLATSVTKQAEKFRKGIALEWLGAELPVGKEFVHINVKLSTTEDEGLTLLCGPGHRFRGSHMMWLTTSRERALGPTLAHEVAHVVLSSRFPRGMPAWANEGIASRYDGGGRKRRRREIMAGFERNGWPQLERILRARSIRPTDEEAYAVSCSLVDFFLSRGDRPRLLDFVQDGSERGWEQALRKHYRISLAELQQGLSLPARTSSDSLPPQIPEF